jgi:cobalt-zinc-cadmium efflux system outer membrane protein
MLVAFTTTLLAGCSSQALVPETGGLPAPDAYASDRDLPLRPVVPPQQPVPGASGRPDYADQLSLRDAVKRAVLFSPAVKAAFIEIDARRGEEVQSAVKPNPQLLVDIENFAGNKDKSGFDSAEETFSLAQTIELGDKRLKRLQAAHLDTSLAGWDHEMVRVKAATDSAQAFVDVLISQEKVKVLGEFVSLADKTRTSVDARVKGGKASSIELDRAAVALARAEALRKGERARLDAAKRKLSALWGAPQADFGTAVGRLGNGYAAPAPEQLLTLLDNNPTLARWGDEINRRVAQLDLEHAKAIPDITVGAGVRSYQENDSTAMVASVSMPIPVFDRNQGNIAAAERRVAKAESEHQATRNELYATLVEALGDLNVAATELKALEKDVLPGAQRAFDKTKIGFDEGKFDILNVLDVQRTVFETRLEVLTARANYEKARVRVEALVGRDLNGL